MNDLLGNTWNLSSPYRQSIDSSSSDSLPSSDLFNVSDSLLFFPLFALLSTQPLNMFASRSIFAVWEGRKNIESYVGLCSNCTDTVMEKSIKIVPMVLQQGTGRDHIYCFQRIPALKVSSTYISTSSRVNGEREEAEDSGESPILFSTKL